MVWTGNKKDNERIMRMLQDRPKKKKKRFFKVITSERKQKELLGLGGMP